MEWLRDGRRLGRRGLGEANFKSPAVSILYHIFSQQGHFAGRGRSNSSGLHYFACQCLDAQLGFLALLVSTCDAVRCGQSPSQPRCLGARCASVWRRRTYERRCTGSRGVLPRPISAIVALPSQRRFCSRYTSAYARDTRRSANNHISQGRAHEGYREEVTLDCQGEEEGEVECRER